MGSFWPSQNANNLEVLLRASERACFRNKLLNGRVGADGGPRHYALGVGGDERLEDSDLGVSK